MDIHTAIGATLQVNEADIFKPASEEDIKSRGAVIKQRFSIRSGLVNLAKERAKKLLDTMGVVDFTETFIEHNAFEGYDVLNDVSDMIMKYTSGLTLTEVDNDPQYRVYVLSKAKLSKGVREDIAKLCCIVRPTDTVDDIESAFEQLEDRSIRKLLGIADAIRDYARASGDVQDVTTFR
jgi:hypothetical protein